MNVCLYKTFEKFTIFALVLHIFTSCVEAEKHSKETFGRFPADINNANGVSVFCQLSFYFRNTFIQYSSKHGQ